MKKIMIMIAMCLILFNQFSFARAKNGWYYAASDVGGAITYGGLGSFLGPLGTSAGIVLGSVSKSAWDYYWDNKMAPLPPLDNPNFDGYTNTDQYSKIGFLHNQFIINFNNSLAEGRIAFNNEAEFMDLIYEKLILFTAQEYNLSQNDLKNAFSKSSMTNKLIESNNYSNYSDAIIGQLGSSLIGTKCIIYLNDLTSGQFNNVDENLIKINSYIAEVNNSNEYSEMDKKTLLQSLSVMKYSYALWSKNINE